MTTIDSMLSNPDQQLAALVDEIAGRLQAGEQVDLEDYVRQYPEHADRLPALLPAMMTLVELGVSAIGGADFPHPNTTATELGTLGDFLIIREVGRGGMGIVYEAEQISLRRRVALKVLPFAAVLDPRQLQRFRNEATAAAQLKHPAIVSVLSVGCERGVHYYAMEFVEGCTLADIIASQTKTSDSDSLPDQLDTGPLAALTTERSGAAFFASVAELGIQAAEALDYAHQRGIVHRDVKPANLMLDAEGKLWITDFGLAQIESDANLTMTGDILGTLRYMSPEQALGRRGVVDQRSDVYSLGVTLYELLTGRPAIQGEQRAEILRALHEQDPRSPRTANRAIPPDLETIILTAITRELSERYTTARELADDLRNFVEHRVIRARRPTLRQRAAKWSRRNASTVLTASTVSVIASVIAIVLISMQRAEAVKQRNRADEKARIAREVVDTFYTDFAESFWIQQSPGMTAVQQNFLEAAIRFYAASAQDGGTEPDAQLKQATAYLRLAVIYEATGQSQNATTAYEKAIDTIVPLTQLHVPTRASVELLATTRRHFGFHLYTQRRLPESVAQLQDSLDLVESLLERDPADPDLLRLRASAHYHLGLTLVGQQCKDDAASAFWRSLETRRELVARFPDVSAYHSELGLSLQDFGDILSPEQQEQFLRAAIDSYENALRLDPGNPTYRIFITRPQIRLGRLLSSTGQYEESEKWHRDACDVMASLVANFPDNVPYAYELAESLFWIGVLYDRMGRHNESVGALEESGEIFLDVRKRASEGGYFQYVDLASSAFEKLSVLYMRAGRRDDAIAAYEQQLQILEQAVHEYASDGYFGNELAWHLATSPLSNRNARERAVVLAKGIVDIDPSSESYWSTLGVAQYQLGDYVAAMESLNRSLELGGSDANCFHLAMAKWKLNDPEAARVLYNRAVACMEEHAAGDVTGAGVHYLTRLTKLQQELIRFRAEAQELLGITTEQGADAPRKEHNEQTAVGVEDFE